MRQLRLIHKGGLGEQERELKAKHVGVTHSVLLGKHLLRALSVLQLYRSGIQKTTKAKRSLSCQPFGY